LKGVVCLRALITLQCDGSSAQVIDGTTGLAPSERRFALLLDVPSTKESSMLVLSRKKNESIIINDDITIVVVEIRGDKVRLGVEAPKEVPVHRNEVYEAIRRNQQKPDAGEQPVSQNDGTAAAE
jgi:carbon storage regulator